MAKRKRGRTQGRFEPGETFSAIPTDVRDSDSYKAVPDYAVRVLVELAGEYRGVNNGNLSLTGKEAAARGIGVSPIPRTVASL